MFAYVPTVPGAVVSVASAIPSPLPSGQTAAEYFACGSNVVAGWSFDGSSFKAPVATPPAPPAPIPAPSAAFLAGQAVLNNGISITSTSTPSINGTYSLSQDSQNMIVGTAEDITLSGGTFPGGASSLPWTDINGTAHVFPSVALFKEFALAVAAYVGEIDVYISNNGAIGSLPTSNAVTIA